MSTKTEREQFLDDIITTALEGGIGYWSVAESYVWGDDIPTAAVISDAESDDPGFENLVVDRALVEKSLALMAAGSVKHLDDSMRARIVSIAAEHPKNLDAGDIDADDADVIVQVGLFGEVTYG